MKDLLNKLTKLVEVKKIIALMVISVFCGLAVNGTISSESFTNIATLIVGFYFGQSTVKGAK